MSQSGPNSEGIRVRFNSRVGYPEVEGDETTDTGDFQQQILTTVLELILKSQPHLSHNPGHIAARIRIQTVPISAHNVPYLSHASVQRELESRGNKLKNKYPRRFIAAWPQPAAHGLVRLPMDLIRRKYATLPYEETHHSQYSFSLTDIDVVGIVVNYSCTYLSLIIVFFCSQASGTANTATTSLSVATAPTHNAYETPDTP